MPSMKDKNYYEILGVSQSATIEEIRHAFQEKARRLHPDVNKDAGAEAEFKEVSEAYAVLSDKEKRARYDAIRSGNPFASAAGSRGAGSSFSGFGFGGFEGFPFEGFGFGKRQSSAGPAYNPQPGADVIFNLSIDEKTAKTGGKKAVTYERFVECNLCHGKGSVQNAEIKECPTCHGRGNIDVDLGTLFGGEGLGSFCVQCPECEGSGKVVADPCSHCHGSGRVLAGAEEVIDIPANSHDGAEIIIPYKGNAGTNNQKSGQLRIRINVPSEKVAPDAKSGFACIGFTIPFLIIGAFLQVLGSLMFFVVLPLLVGIPLVVKAIVKKHNVYWWKNAGASVLEGATNGFLFAAVIALLISCSQGLQSK